MSNTYTLIIKNTGKKAVAQDVGGVGGISGNAASAEQSAGGATSESGVDAGKILSKVFGYKQVKAVASSAVAYRISTVQLRTGSSEAQQRAQFAYSIGQQSLGILEGAYIGALKGSIVGGGLMGAVVGAMFGTTSAVMSTFIEYNMYAKTLDLEYQIEKNSQNLSAQRATVSGSRYQNATMG